MQQPDNLPSPFWANEIGDLKSRLRLINQKQEELQAKLEALSEKLPGNVTTNTEEIASLKRLLEELRSDVMNIKQLMSDKFDEAEPTPLPKKDDDKPIIEKILKEIEPRLVNVQRTLESAIISRLDHLHPQNEIKPTIPVISLSPSVPVNDTFAQLLGEATTNEVITGTSGYFQRLLQLRDHLFSWLSQVGKSWKASIVHIVSTDDGLEIHPINLTTINHQQKVICTQCGSLTGTLHVQCFVAVTSETTSDCYVLIPKGEYVSSEYPVVYNQLVEMHLEGGSTVNLIKQAAVLQPFQEGGRTRFIIQQKIIIQ
jgi:hypothetical protein